MSIDKQGKKQAHTAQGVNRRQFLHQVGRGVGAGLLAAQSISYSAAAETLQRNDVTKDDLPKVPKNKVPNNKLPTQSAPQCAAATIETRLFASSNVGGSEARNRLALARLRCAGFAVQNPEIVSRQYLRFAGTDAQRAADFQNIATGAVAAPKLLLGVRGGYGAMRILPNVDWQTLGRILQERGTIVAGFSDVTAIQCALLAQGGMSSLAAPMLYSEFGKTQPDIVSSQAFVTALTDKALTIDVPALASDEASDTLPRIMAKNSAQRVTGTLWGGNLSVVSALAGSPYLPRINGGIVFLEDVGEQAYRVERMLYDLYLAGAFKGQQAIVFGALSGTGADSYDARYDALAVIRQLHELTGLPIYMGMPFGHVGKKQSFPLGAQCQIEPDTQGGYQLSFSGYPAVNKDDIYPPALWQGA